MRHLNEAPKVGMLDTMSKLVAAVAEDEPEPMGYLRKLETLYRDQSIGGVLPTYTHAVADRIRDLRVATISYTQEFMASVYGAPQ